MCVIERAGSWQACVVISHPGQYSTDSNLRARQRLWTYLDPPFDLIGWVVDLAGISAGFRVLDVGCGNGGYLSLLLEKGAFAVGSDLSRGMLSASSAPTLVNSDAQAIPFRDSAFDVVLAAHMLYHVPDKKAAVTEMRRVMADGGTCVAVTNGSQHIASLRRLVEAIVDQTAPGWRMMDWATRAFSLDCGGETMREAFDSVECVRPPVRGDVVITDANVVADYVASVGTAYEVEVNRSWAEVVEEVRVAVQAVIDRDGAFVTAGDTGAFVCR